MEDRASSTRTFQAGSEPFRAGRESLVVISLVDLQLGIQGWLSDCEDRVLSPRTIEARESLTTKLVWWLKSEGDVQCGTPQIKGFLRYIRHGHAEKGGRWAASPNNGGKTRPPSRAAKAVSSRTIHTYFGHLKTLFEWLADELELAESPMARMRPPALKRKKVQPFTREQVKELMEAAKRSERAIRDLAILHFLLDTGVRASELCKLQMGQLDLQGRRAKVIGKGDKERTVHFGRKASAALWKYLRQRGDRNIDVVFLSEGGTKRNQGLTASGLYQIVNDLGKVARLQMVRCSPHTCRHYFAVDFLRRGGSVFVLQELLGHESVSTVQIYVKLAQADLAGQHKRYSPMDNLE